MHRCCRAGQQHPMGRASRPDGGCFFQAAWKSTQSKAAPLLLGAQGAQLEAGAKQHTGMNGALVTLLDPSLGFWLYLLIKAKNLPLTQGTTSKASCQVGSQSHIPQPAPLTSLTGWPSCLLLRAPIRPEEIPAKKNQMSKNARISLCPSPAWLLSHSSCPRHWCLAQTSTLLHTLPSPITVPTLGSRTDGRQRLGGHLYLSALIVTFCQKQLSDGSRSQQGDASFLLLMPPLASQKPIQPICCPLFQFDSHRAMGWHYNKDLVQLSWVCTTMSGFAAAEAGGCVPYNTAAWAGPITAQQVWSQAGHKQESSTQGAAGSQELCFCFTKPTCTSEHLSI